MTRLKLLGAAAVLSTLVAGPALAQEVIQEPGAFGKTYPNSNYTTGGYGVTASPSYRGGGAYDAYGSFDGPYQRGPIGGPLGFAGDVVGGAVGTAGAIVSAPFRNSNAYYDGPMRRY
jgi:hypothetical protein